ncbi:hypothetical protein HMF8227_02919 [Saliniradius amylolyticus]|uniref:Uncharacterized protein n=1 Tax=Saliniradius amylolyticus TaxID=2183582 RepID=A0A2S2E8X3_9ALTE|nr:YkgJ family cysteine cluster protein [Saliniradius amylolyticus]AWL13367.1 hypothetical protein HMF8227_02919 [Saliniradius amylolyticus]
MQYLRALAQRIETVYQQLNLRFSDYQQQQGLSCISGCGRCCTNPDVEASPLEMLPLALNLFDQGQAEVTLDKLRAASGFHCLHYQRLSLDGARDQCGIYAHRPGICRMFGAAGVRGKDGQARLSVCQPIKTARADAYHQTLSALEVTPPPMIADGRQQLVNLDPLWGRQTLPINQALSWALEKVLTAAYYDDPDNDGTQAA